MSRYIDLTGQKFGRLTVLKDVGRKNRQVLWLCKCDCGNEIKIEAGRLKSGNTKSCGCYNKEKLSERMVDLTGKKFGRLTVIRLDHINKDTFFECLCDCGNKKIIRGYSLTMGDTTSCGCYQKEMASKSNYMNLSGKRFGKLIVLEDAGRSIGGSSKWKCQCDCGNILIVGIGSLRCGHTKSCGCIRESEISSQLKKYFFDNYDAKIEYKIIRHPENNHWLPFDIFIPEKNIFIEVQGEQHYKFVPFWHKTEEKFNNNQKLDKLKKQYAKKHGVYIEIDLRKVKTTEQAIEIIESYL